MSALSASTAQRFLTKMHINIFAVFVLTKVSVLAYTSSPMPGVCSSTSFKRQSFKESFEASYNHKYLIRCGLFDWNWARCTKNRQVYQKHYRIAYKEVYRTDSICCQGWIKQGNKCLRADSTPAISTTTRSIFTLTNSYSTWPIGGSPQDLTTNDNEAHLKSHVSTSRPMTTVFSSQLPSSISAIATGIDNIAAAVKKSTGNKMNAGKIAGAVIATFIIFITGIVAVILILKRRTKVQNTPPGVQFDRSNELTIINGSLSNSEKTEETRQHVNEESGQTDFKMPADSSYLYAEVKRDKGESMEYRLTKIQDRSQCNGTFPLVSAPGEINREEGWFENSIYATSGNDIKPTSSTANGEGDDNKEEGWEDNSLYSNTKDSEQYSAHTNQEEGWEENIIYASRN